MKSLSVALCLWVSATLCPAQNLDAVLARMDKAAPSFHAMSADVKMVTYTALLKDTTDETGTIKMQRIKPGNVRAILTFNGAQSASPWLGFYGKTLRVYYPAMHTYQDFPVGKESNVLNQYLLLGFGSSGKELAQSYTITFLGAEKVAGKDTSMLQLDPKDPDVKEKLKKVIVWIPNNEANPVQQQFWEPSGNFRKITYSGISLDPKINGTLELQLPSGVSKVK